MIVGLLHPAKLLSTLIRLTVGLLLKYFAIIILLYRPTISLLNYLGLLVLTGRSSREDDLASILKCTTNSCLCNKVVCPVGLGRAENLSLNRIHLNITICVSYRRVIVVFYSFIEIVSAEEATFRCNLLSK